MSACAFMFVLMSAMNTVSVRKLVLIIIFVPWSLMHFFMHHTVLAYTILVTMQAIATTTGIATTAQSAGILLNRFHVDS